VAVHDLNGDDVLDLVSVNYLGDDISVLLGNGDGTFPQGTNYPVGHRPNAVAVGDLDGNGSPDLAVSNYWYGDISVLLGKGKGLFNPAFNLPAGTTSTLSVAIGDLDGNGFLDLVAANWGGNVSVLLGNGDGTFQPYSQFRAGDQSSSVAIGDLNGDGVQDLAVAGSIPESSTVSILLGNGDGTFGSPRPYPVARPGAISVAVGDLDGDEVLDLAVAGGYLDSSLPPSALGGVSVLLGNGDGTFQTAVGYDCATSPHTVAIGDLDGDGIKDLAVTNYITAAISVLMGHGDGTFQSAVNYGLPQGSRSVAIGDLDRDGAMDLAAGTPTSEVGRYQVTVLSQKAIHCPDLDGDGYGDPGTTLCPFAAYDCDDFDPSIHPNAPETNGDGLDSNCNGMENCFIATAAFESTLDPKLDLLRAFRDRYLMSNGLGESFVEIYYTYGQHVAGVIAEHPWLRCLVRILMLPLIGFVSLLV